jgi:anti-sigma factor RsiW
MAEPSTTDADALMSAYLDKQLAPDEAAKVEKLLAESPEAREELDGLASMLKLVKGLPEVEAPPDFYEKVAKKLRRRRGRGEVLWMLALPFQVLSVVMILVVAVTYMLLHLDNDPSVKLERDPAAVKRPDVSPLVP